MTRFRFHLRDRKTGELFLRDQYIDAANRTEVRRLLAADWRTNVPQGRSGARDLGFVPFRDCQIIWADQRSLDATRR